MRLAFIDTIEWEYDVNTAYQRPLGGTQSAVCYLAEQLAASGNDVYLVNESSDASKYRGVACIPMHKISHDILDSLDAAVVVGSGEAGSSIHDYVGPHTKVVLWTQHTSDEPAMQALGEPSFRDAYDGFAMVSDWQLRSFLAEFDLDPQRCRVLRNAIGPAFQNAFSHFDHILQSKPQHPILAYTSTPFRGLELLLDLFPRIRSQAPDVSLRVYSSMSVYQIPHHKDLADYGPLYQRCRDMPGVEYIGSLAQTDLAGELRQAAILSYPNVFPETSCIAVMEAMASGCFVITSRLAALPETTAGFGALIDATNDKNLYSDQFVDRTVETIEMLSRPETSDLEADLARQVQFINDRNTWNVRAAEWMDWLGRLAAS